MGWELTPGGPFHGPYVAHLVATHGSSDQLTSHLATVDLATTPWLQWIQAIPPSAASGVTPFCGGLRPLRRGSRPEAWAKARARPSTVHQTLPRALAPRPALWRGEGSSVHHKVSGTLPSSQSQSSTTDTSPNALLTPG